MNILHIDSSILGEHSVSRRLSRAVVNRLKALSPESRVTYRDLGGDPLPQQYGALTMAIAGMAPEGSKHDPQSGLCQDVATSQRALDEVMAADTLVIGAPMYNFSIPSQLKSWLDAIVVANKTFRYDQTGVHGLLGDKRVIIASSRGGLYAPGTPGAAMEHHESYLRSILGFVGITRVEVVRAEGLKLGAELAETAIATALEQAAQLEAA